MESARSARDVQSVGERLRTVFWLGGGSGAGKSTIARNLAARHGLLLYATDDVMSDHGRLCHPKDCPFLFAFRAMTMDERWVDRPPKTMLETFHWFRGEGFDLIIDDLLKLPPNERVIVEGFRLLPRLVKPLLVAGSRAVWLLPTPEFRFSAFENRGSLWSIAGKTRDPPRALGNLLERDRLFTDRLRHEAEAAHVTTIEVDGSMRESALEDRVAAHFGL